MELGGSDVFFYKVRINIVYNFFGSLLFYFLYQGTLVEFDYYFIVSIIKEKTRLYIGRYCCPSLRFRRSYCHYLLFF